MKMFVYDKNNDQIYVNMLLRRRFCKRVCVMFTVFVISFYATMLLFGDLMVPRVMHLTELNRCPACYGLSICPELYSNQIMMERMPWSLQYFFNAKNIYTGYTNTNRRVVFKKLAHNWELKRLDSNLCNIWNLKRNCQPVDLLNSSANVNEKITNLVQYNLTVPETKPRTGLVMCPYANSIFDFIKPVLEKNIPNKSYKSDMINIWTMLSVNPEPIILQMIPKSKGWPVPAYAGVCGRLEVVAHEGTRLSLMKDIDYNRKLRIARNILMAAFDFTFKHERFRFYLMDWSLDNIVVNEHDDVTFVDLEDVVVIDKHASPEQDLAHWYSRHYTEGMIMNKGEAIAFSIQDMCKHHLSDHNLYATCQLFVGNDDSWLLPMPLSVRPNINNELNSCLNSPVDDRFQPATLLLHKLECAIRNNC